jgi:hypothetical protein
MRQKIADQVASASRNDAAPILGILFEGIALKRIDLVVDDAHNCHWQSFRPLTCGRIFTKGESGHRGDHAANGFAAVYVVGGEASVAAFRPVWWLPCRNTSLTIKL